MSLVLHSTKTDMTTSLTKLLGFAESLHQEAESKKCKAFLTFSLWQ